MKLETCDFVAGYFGGASAAFVSHPIDTIKVWQQVFKTKVSTTMYNIIIRSNGLNGFYRGFYFPFFTHGIIHSATFGIYGSILRLFQERCSTEEARVKLLKHHRIIAGTCAGFTQAFLGCPFEVVKIRLQTQGHVGGSLHCLHYIYKVEGFYGLYRGLVPMIWRDVLPYGIYCVVYDSIYDASFKIESLRKLRSHLNNSSNEVYLKFESFVTSFAALIASLLSWSLILPLDVVKTNLQAETNPNIHKNMVECLLMLIRTHNHKALFSGLYMNIAKSYATILGFQYCLNKCQKHVLENKQ